MSKEIVLNGCVEIPDDVSEEAFCDAFIEFVENHGWYYGGGIYEYDKKRDGNVKSGKEEQPLLLPDLMTHHETYRGFDKHFQCDMIIVIGVYICGYMLKGAREIWLFC